MDKLTKTWKKKPTKKEIMEYLKSFIKVLSAGELDKAKNMVHHSTPYWEEQVYELWKFHTKDKSIKDKTFEGGEWKKNSSWTKSLTISEKAKWLNPKRFIVEIVYDGKPTGYVADFEIDENDDNEFYITYILFTERKRHPWLG